MIFCIAAHLIIFYHRFLAFLLHFLLEISLSEMLIVNREMTNIIFTRVWGLGRKFAPIPENQPSDLQRLGD